MGGGKRWGLDEEVGPRGGGSLKGKACTSLAPSFCSLCFLAAMSEQFTPLHTPASSQFRNNDEPSWPQLESLCQSHPFLL